MAHRRPERRRSPTRAITLGCGSAMAVAIAVVVALSAMAGARCGAPLGLRPVRNDQPICEAASNGVEYASYVCVVPGVAGVDYGEVSAVVRAADGKMLGHWDAPIRYDMNGRAAPVDGWGPLDTSTHLADDSDGVFGPGDAFHLDSVQMYRFAGSNFALRGECWSGSVVLQ